MVSFRFLRLGDRVGESRSTEARRHRGVLARIRWRQRWARLMGLRRFARDWRLNPLDRMRLGFRRWWWGQTHSVPPNAFPVYVVGVQRSGTNAVLRAFFEAGEFEIRNEDDSRAFNRFRLRPDPVIRHLIERSRHQYIVFKPLCDSHRVADLLDGLGTPSHGRAIWVYRSVDARVRSAIAFFGDRNRRVLAQIARGEPVWWEAERLSEENRELIRSFDYQQISPESAAALFWYVRNSLFFQLRLDRREDVFLMSYDALMEHPERTIRQLCSFLGFPYRSALSRPIEQRSDQSSEPLDLDPRIRELCSALQQRLDRTASPPSEVVNLPPQRGGGRLDTAAHSPTPPRITPS
jgi:hypothetical protein